VTKREKDRGHRDKSLTPEEAQRAKERALGSAQAREEHRGRSRGGDCDREADGAPG